MPSRAFKGAKHPHAELRIYTCIGSSMCNCTLPFVFWELILASILQASNMISFNAFHLLSCVVHLDKSNMPHPKCPFPLPSFLWALPVRSSCPGG